jgi:hypothetical protein
MEFAHTTRVSYPRSCRPSSQDRHNSHSVAASTTFSTRIAS